MHPHQPGPLAAAELRVTDELWSRGESSIRDLRDSLYPRGRKDDATGVYRAAARREDLIGGELRRVAGRFGGDSLSPLLTFLVEAGGLTAKERAHLRSLLDDDTDKARD